MKVRDVKGVGGRAEAILSGAGIVTAEALAAADAETVNDLGLSETLIDKAKAAIKPSQDDEPVDTVKCRIRRRMYVSGVGTFSPGQVVRLPKDQADRSSVERLE